MKYLFRNFISTLRHYKTSSLLNIIGMAVAFAAFYVILTQVRWGFTRREERPWRPSSTAVVSGSSVPQR